MLTIMLIAKITGNSLCFFVLFMGLIPKICAFDPVTGPKPGCQGPGSPLYSLFINERYLKSMIESQKIAFIISVFSLLVMFGTMFWDTSLKIL